MSNACDDLLPLFLEEFDERLTRMEDLLLGDDATSEISMKSVKREMHTLKGNTAAVGFPACSSLCHQLEDYIDHANEPAELVDQLLDGIQVLRGAVACMSEGRDIADDTRQALRHIGTQPATQPTSAPSPPAPSPPTPSVSEARRDASATIAKGATSEPVDREDGREYEPLKAGFSVCVAAAEGLADTIGAMLAGYGVRSLPLECVIAADSLALREAVGDSQVFMLHLEPNTQAVAAAIRTIERYRLDESARGVFGEARKAIVAVVEGGEESTCRELRTAGAQYAFARSTDERAGELLHRLFIASLRQAKARKSIRFRDVKDTIATFRDGTRIKATVRDESHTGIALKLLDASACEVFAPVAVEMLSVAMPAHIVRVAGRDELGYVTLGLRWGHYDSPQRQ